MMIKKLGVFLILLSVSGCVSDSTITHVGAPKYRDKYPISLNIKYLDVVNSYLAPEKEPHVEHLMPYRLCDFATEWAHHRLKASGDKGFAIITIEQASVTQTPLSKHRNWVSTLAGRKESDRFDADVAIRIDFMDHKGFPNGVAFAKVRRSQTILENTSIAERQEIWQKLSQQAIDALDEELENNLRHNTSRLLAD